MVKMKKGLELITSKGIVSSSIQREVSITPVFTVWGFPHFGVRGVGVGLLLELVVVSLY